MPIARTKPLFRRLISETKVATLIPDYTGPVSAKSPFKLEVREQARVTSPIQARCFLDGQRFRVGIRDPFGRIHWAIPKRAMDLESHLHEQRRVQTERLFCEFATRLRDATLAVVTPLQTIGG